jgi:phosphoadenosine phosphosulfate reductase
VRWAESAKRKNGQGLVRLVGKTVKRGLVLNTDNDEARRMVESCYRTQTTMVNPIIDWLDEDVWEFIRTERIPYCGLYDEGFKRLGCIGCPMNTRAEAELRRYPKYREAYLRAFDRMLKRRLELGKTNWEWGSVEEVMDWWIGKQPKKQLPGQMEIELF